MTGTEDLFTPIHKGIRSIIYNVAGRLQTNDFGDLEGSRALLADVEHELGSSLWTGCVLCLLHAHAGDEDAGVFPALAAVDAGLIQTFIDEHRQFTIRLEAVSHLARELAGRPSAAERVALGVVLNQQLNSFFATYLDHLNREETQVVPFMRERFTDEQVRAMRGSILAAIPRERLMALFRWILPSLNVNELTDLLRGARAVAPPPMVAAVMGIAAETVPPDRLAVVKARLGLATP